MARTGAVVLLAVAVLLVGGWGVSEYRFDTCADRAVSQYPLGSSEENLGSGRPLWGPGSNPRAERLAARRKAMNACSRWPI